MEHYFTNNINLKSNIQKVSVIIKNTSYYFYTDNGVFSKGELDFGTMLLLENFKYSYPQGNSVLDIGCGCGPIGIYLSKLGFTVDMTDINERALNLCKKASCEQELSNNIYLSDEYEKILKKYDYIISNPPIRVGKEKLYKILITAKEHLTENGELWIVIRKKQGADSVIRNMSKYYNISIICKKKGYYIIKATVI